MGKSSKEFIQRLDYSLWVKLRMDLKELDSSKPYTRQTSNASVFTPAGVTQTWEPHERLPSASVRELLTRYLDITTPPTPNFLHILAECAQDNDQRTRLDQLATVGAKRLLFNLFLGW